MPNVNCKIGYFGRHNYFVDFSVTKICKFSNKLPIYVA